MTQIAFVAGTYQPDRCGVAHYTACLRSHLPPDIRSIVLTTQAAAIATGDATVRGAVQGWQLSDLPDLVRSIRAANPDLLHIQHAAGTYGFERAIFLLPLLLRLRGWQQPIVTTVHEYGWWEWQPDCVPPRLLEGLKQWGQTEGWWDREDGFLLTQSSAIVTTNAEAETVMLDRLPQLAHRVSRIPIAANIEVAPIERAAAHRLLDELGWAEEGLTIAFFGFLHPVKGLEILLSAFQDVRAQHPQTRLLLIGGVESLALRGDEAKAYWEKIHALVAHLGLGRSVHLTGYLSAEKTSHYLSAADIGVLPFHHGVTLKSGSLLTLMAHGLPTVATRAQPPEPDLADGEILRLVPPRDREALAAALLDLMANPTLRSRFSQVGRVFVQPFCWESIAQKHGDIYRSLL